MLKSLWAYRGFISGSVKREFQLKYKNSLLGAAWTLINPLAMVLVYTVIFSEIMKAKFPGVETKFSYSIYICSGILTWGLFAEVVGKGQNMFIDNANLLKKISFPRMCLPIIIVFNACINFAIIFGLFLIFLAVSENWPNWIGLALIPIICIQIIFAVGLGILLGVLNVFFRDIGHAFTIFMQFWFWFTPIVYPLQILPEHIRLIMEVNPMYPIINAYHEILVSCKWPDWHSLMYPLFFGLSLCFFGLRFFKMRVGEMVDEL